MLTLAWKCKQCANIFIGRLHVVLLSIFVLHIHIRQQLLGSKHVYDYQCQRSVRGAGVSFRIYQLRGVGESLCIYQLIYCQLWWEEYLFLQWKDQTTTKDTTIKNWKPDQNWHPASHVGTPHQMWSAPQVQANPPILFTSTSLISPYFPPGSLDLHYLEVWGPMADVWDCQVQWPRFSCWTWQSEGTFFKSSESTPAPTHQCPSHLHASCAQHAHTLLHMLKIPCQLFCHRRPNGGRHGNR